MRFFNFLNPKSLFKNLWKTKIKNPNRLERPHPWVKVLDPNSTNIVLTLNIINSWLPGCILENTIHKKSQSKSNHMINQLINYLLIANPSLVTLDCLLFSKLWLFQQIRYKRTHSIFIIPAVHHPSIECGCEIWTAQHMPKYIIVKTLAYVDLGFHFIIIIRKAIFNQALILDMEKKNRKLKAKTQDNLATTNKEKWSRQLLSLFSYSNINRHN